MNASTADAATLARLAEEAPKLILLYRKDAITGAHYPGGPVPFVDEEHRASIYLRASERLAEWALSVRSDRETITAELFFGSDGPDPTITLSVPLKRAHAESGFDLCLSLKRFAARVAEAAGSPPAPLSPDARETTEERKLNYRRREFYEGLALRQQNPYSKGGK